MDIIFNKDHLPMLQKIAEGSALPREYWRAACFMRDETGFRNQQAVKKLLLQNGAFQGDPWAMCELARYYYQSYEAAAETNLPLALSWWQKAAKLDDPGAHRDLADLEPELESAVRQYQSSRDSSRQYEDLELRCAMLTEWILTRMGRDCWDTLEFPEQLRRVQTLMDAAAAQLFIKPVSLLVKEKLRMSDGREAGGLAYINERKIGLRRCDFTNYHRLIQVLFHELGHFVVYSILRDDALGCETAEQMERFGITAERIAAWKRHDKGLHVPVDEEDPDTLSYGVYTCWMVLFG